MVVACCEYKGASPDYCFSVIIINETMFVSGCCLRSCSRHRENWKIHIDREMEEQRETSGASGTSSQGRVKSSWSASAFKEIVSQSSDITPWKTWQLLDVFTSAYLKFFQLIFVVDNQIKVTTYHETLFLSFKVSRAGYTWDNTLRNYSIQINFG